MDQNQKKDGPTRRDWIKAWLLFLIGEAISFTMAYLFSISLPEIPLSPTALFLAAAMAIHGFQAWSILREERKIARGTF